MSLKLTAKRDLPKIKSAAGVQASACSGARETCRNKLKLELQQIKKPATGGGL
jgi:hypothetical protein